ncbi:hypothetical protein NLU13_4984 [Sarocladium strictum]|uniref:Zn(2)-C6 fungal-type domain-containing protein n=1 Tax=Sarocladium strictum TaxID=5046 RepID=A0AA39L8Q3_SARSR|nr:hypothetical protein NLU13_4984 [Sarocladium strictum]
MPRGRAACESCRSRKQKCDEQRPTCSRCQDTGRSCVWLRHQKRGPVKGYSEMLEQRLHATESALLKLLSVVDLATVQTAFHNEEASTSSLSRVAADTFGRTEGARTVITGHWEQYPLHTAEGVMRWAQKRLATTQTASRATVPEGLPSTSTTTPSTSISRSASGNKWVPPVGTSQRSDVMRRPDNLPHDLRHHPGSVGNTNSSQDSPASIQLVGAFEGESNNSRAPRKDFGLPEEFSKRYLW